jgi:hypothetical protein
MGFLGDKHEEVKPFMSMHWPSMCITTLVGATALGGVPQENALIIKERNARYKAAQQAGTRQGLNTHDSCQWQLLTKTSRRCLG